MAECNLAAELGMKCAALTEAQRQVAELEMLLAGDRQVLKSTRAEWTEREHKLQDRLRTAAQTIATLEAKARADRNKIDNLEVKNADEFYDRNKIVQLEGKIAFLEEALADVRLNESRCLRELGEKAEKISDLNADRAKLQEIANTAKLDLAVARSVAEGWRARANGLGSDIQLTCDLSAATAAIDALRKTNIGLIAERDNAESLRYAAQKYSKEAFERGRASVMDQLRRIRSELTDSAEERVNTQDIARRVSDELRTAKKKLAKLQALRPDLVMTDMTARSCRKLAAYDAIKELVSRVETAEEGKNVDGTV